jgi:hypothetical protein
VVDSTDLKKWGTITLQPPDFLEDIKSGVNSLAEFLTEVLDILLAGLEIAKAFSVGYIDPIANLLQTLIDQLSNLLRDVAQIGIYLTGDWNLLERPYEDLRGGFSSYEQRMIARLVDKNDPTRPNISSSEKVFAAFGYISVDIGQIDQAVQMVQSILKLFNAEVPPPASSLPVPTIEPKPLYGGEAGYTGLIEAFQTTDVPDVVKVTWKVAGASGKAPQTQYPSQPPSGFLVSVSTRREGIRLSFDRPIKDGGKKEADGDDDDQVQPREFGYVRDNLGRPIVLYGGSNTYFVPNELSYSRPSQIKKVDKGVLVLKDGVTRVYGTLSSDNQSPIDLDLLEHGLTLDHFIQDVFYVSAESSPLSWTSDTYSIELKLDQFPNDATFEQGSDGSIERTDLGKARTYFIRVATVSDKITSDELFEWDLDDAAKKKDNAGKTFNCNLRSFSTDGVRPTVGADISDWSEPIEVSFPSVTTNQYLQVLETALTVFALSRPDLPTLTELGMGQRLGFDGLEPYEIETPQTADEVYQAVMDGKLSKNVARQAIGLEPYRDLYYKYEFHVPAPPAMFRKLLRERVRKAAQDIYQRAGSNPDLEKTIVESTEELRTWTLGEILDRHTDPLVRAMGAWFSSGKNMEDPTILEALESPDEEGGLAHSVDTVGIAEETVNEWYYVPNVIIARLPQFIENQETERKPWKEIEEMSGKLVSNLGNPNRGQLKFVKAYGKRDKKTGKLRIEWRPSTADAVSSRVELVKRSAPTDWSSPVIFSNLVGLDTITRAINLGDANNEKTVGERGAVAFARTVFANVVDNTIMSQVRLVLGFATAAQARPRSDSQWLALRYTSAFPSVDDAIKSLDSWIGATKQSTKDTGNALEDFIKFLEARITETQQYIRRINAMIQSIFPFAVPAMSGLLLLSSGTDGVLSDFVTAEDKPFDSPFAYGAGIAVLVPGIALAELFIEMFGFFGEDIEVPPTQELEANPLFVPVPTEELEAPSGDNDPPQVL